MNYDLLIEQARKDLDGSIEKSQRFLQLVNEYLESVGK
jgi:hypothetical protein